MKLDPKYANIGKVAASDDRPHISEPCLVNGRLLATNGHCLVSVPVRDSADDHDGHISAEFIKDACKAGKKRKLAEVDIRATDKQLSDGERHQTRHDHGEFPPCDRIIEECKSKTTHVIGLNPALLLDMVTAMGARKGDYVRLRLSFEGDDRHTLNPFGVELTLDEHDTDQPFGVLMPVRVETL